VCAGNTIQPHLFRLLPECTLACEAQSGTMARRLPFWRSDNLGVPMSDVEADSGEPKPTKEARREETQRAFREIVEKERRDRLAKTMRLRSMRLVKS
jgi:hypothetical protein